MRIISGSHRGRKLFPPSNLPVRPTTDIAKEALFNILRTRIDLEESSILDLFAGTGNLSFEFASRGCRDVTAVDSNPRCTDYIRKTAEMLNFGNLKVIRADAFYFLKSHTRSYDLIFADPPYDLEKAASVPEMILKTGLLAPEGILIFEHPGKIDFSHIPRFKELRHYGKVNFSFFEQEP